MSQCPLCAAKITEDFGLIECPNCSAQLIVHMDGRVEYSGGQASGDSLEEFREKEEEFQFSDAPQEFEAPATQVGAQPLEEEPFEEPFEEPLGDIGSQASDDALFGADEATVAMPPEATDDLFDPEPPPPRPTPIPRAVKPPVPEPIVVPEGSADLSDIARFGNSDASSLRDGSLRYNLLISGIDTADVREAFREAITDRKLVWDTDAILRSLKNGEVRIQNVTPPKAYILISRLRNLPIHVFWEQYGIVQS